jgi:RNA polymerase sigma-70 factor (ECF subfamily)
MKDMNATFNEAFRTHADELFRHAFFRISDRERAVDLVQECFLRAYTYAKKNHIDDIRAFLYRTLRNLIIDEYRKKKSYSLDAMLEVEDGNAETLLPTDDTNTLLAAADRLDAKAALSKVSELPHEYGEIIILRFVDGLSPGEIAERIDISENLVSVRIHRALKALRALFENP